MDASVVDVTDAPVVEALLVDGNKSDSKSELEESALVKESVLLADVGGNSGGKSVTASLEEIEVADSEKLAVVDPLILELESVGLSSAVLADEAPKGEDVVAKDKLSKVDDSANSLVDVDTAEALDGVGATDVALAAITSAG
ncbi:hypothetical protein GGI06_001700 [Coemansia sp. S85]|nr:hypothetical protein GGI06_001700 [Coemansia sp. S85]